MSNEYGYGVVNDLNSPIVIVDQTITFVSREDAMAYVEMVNATSNLNETKNTPWRPVKLTWSEIDE